MTCDLVLYLLEDKIYYALISPQREIVACKEFCKKDPTIGKTLFLRLVFEREALLSFPYADCRVYIGDTAFTLVPEAYRSDPDHLRLARLLLDDWVFNDELLQRKIPPEASWILFLHSTHIAEVLGEYLPYYTLSHIAHPLIGLSHQLRGRYPSHMLLMFQPKKMILLTCIDQGLTFCNVFPCHGATDVFYFSEAVKQQRQVGPQDFPVFWVGEAGDSFLEDIHQFFPDIRQPEGEVSSGATGQYWKYGFLASLSK